MMAEHVQSFQDLLIEGHLPTREFILPLHELITGGESIKLKGIPAHYNRDGELLLKIENIATFPLASELLGLNEPKAKCVAEFLELIFVDASSLGPPRKVNAIAKLRKTPSLICKIDEAHSVSAYLINGPNLNTGPRTTSYTFGNYQLFVKDLKQDKEPLNISFQRQHKRIITHELTLKHSSGDMISSSEAIGRLSHFCHFLTFVKGNYCGLGHIIGKDKANNVNYCYLGFNSSDSFQNTSNWFTTHSIRFLNDLYQSYSEAVSRESDVYAISKSIAFYRASNYNSSTISEIALISSFAALEILVPHILETQAKASLPSHEGWIAELITTKPKFASQIRSVAKYINLNADLLEHAPELKKRLNSLNGHDAYDLLCLFRNRIVHPGKRFKCSRSEIFDMWNISQFIVEVLILYMIGAPEDIKDRRTMVEVIKFPARRGLNFPQIID